MYWRNAGATEIFTILLSSGKNETENRQYGNLVSLLERTLDIFTTDVGKNDLIIPTQYNEALKYIDAVKNKMVHEGVSRDQVNSYFTIHGSQNPYEDKIPLKLFTIRPDQPLGGGPGGLSFDMAEMKAMISTGIRSATLFKDSLQPGDITWV